ncbi:MAG: sel1 repeat family protein, partial [Alphaproteobacteria bacterium]|nr:sel1 repeat family protein [Alphaproteobacteria bacterium]
MIRFGAFLLFGMAACSLIDPAYRPTAGADAASGLALHLPLAEEGMVGAQYVVGSMLRDGKGAPSDRIAARAWYERAARGGDHDAQIALAEMLESGTGGAVDREAAAGWRRKAAE